MVGLVIESGLGVFEAGDVSEHGHEMGDEPVPVAHGADGQPARVELAVFAPVGNLALPVTFGSQLMPHGGVERAVMQAGSEQARGMAEGFAFAVTGDFGERAVDGADVLLGIGDQYAFGSALEYRRRLVAVFPASGGVR